jgi:RNA polymerase sigma-70 factor (ECF subfamily)
MSSVGRHGGLAASQTPEAINQAVAALRSFGTAPARTLTDPDASAVAVIYQGYASMLHHVAGQIVGSREDAEDVVHDVFCKLPWVIGQCRSRLGGWLKQVTVSTALMHLRKTRLRREEGLVENCDVSPAAVDEITLLSLDHADELRRALAQLSKPLRRVVHLRFYLGYSHQQIATTLGISPNASEVRLCRALKQLRQTIRSDSVRARGMAAVKRTAPSASLIGARAS